ncbi:MAG: phosphoenolpyruvate carboxykinase (ATP) [Phycisphaeraceae bacterium]|nr:MAG: phosphoenolpyruvate carboxykinase (ATP) [Phycisphaeraceae bacterium]
MSQGILSRLDLSPKRFHANLSAPALIERAIEGGEGRLASNGALVCLTGDRTGRSPKDKYLEDSAGIHGKIWWGKVNQPVKPEGFEKALSIAVDHLNGRPHLYGFRGYAGADAKRRVHVEVVAEQAWHALFASTLFIRLGSRSAGGATEFKKDWTILNAGRRRLTAEEQKAIGVSGPVAILQSLEKKTVVILGTEYAGEMKKSIFYALNYDLPEVGVFPMHCSCNTDKDGGNAALFFGLSGTGKTTLSADPNRALIGDDEHGWSDTGVFNFEGGCYAKCIKLSKEGEPQIWSAIRFGSVLENVLIDEATRVPDYDSSRIAENSRVTYPVDFIDNATIPSVCGHPRNVVFLTADAYGVLPPVSKLSPEQAMYYFVNGYTSKLAGTEAGVTEPQPNFSACFGAPFLPRPPKVYAEMLAKKIAEHKADVWLLNTGWTGGPYGMGSRFKLAYTRAMVTAMLNGSLKSVPTTPDPIFGLPIPASVPGVPAEVLNPRNTWKDGSAYDAQARKLAKQFRENDATFDLPDAVRAAGPRV